VRGGATDWANWWGAPHPFIVERGTNQAGKYLSVTFFYGIKAFELCRAGEGICTLSPECWGGPGGHSGVGGPMAAATSRAPLERGQLERSRHRGIWGKDWGSEGGVL